MKKKLAEKILCKGYQLLQCWKTKSKWFQYIVKKEKFTKLSTLQSDTGGHMMLLAPVTITKVLQFHSVFSLVLNAKKTKQKKLYQH